MGLEHEPHWPCSTPIAQELFHILSSEKVSSASRRKVGDFMARHEFFEDNEMRLAEKRLGSLAQAKWHRENVTPAGWHENVCMDYRDIVCLFATVLRHPQCDPTRLVWGPENEPFKQPGDGGYVADVCNGSWYAPGGPGSARPAAVPAGRGSAAPRARVLTFGQLYLCLDQLILFAGGEYRSVS